MILVSSFTTKYFSPISPTKCSYPMFQSCSFHSFSHVLVVHQFYIASIMNRVSISAEHLKSQLGIPYHMTYTELNLAYINLATESSYTKPSPRHLRAQHTSNPATFKPRGYTLLPPSHHSQCVGIRLSIGLAEVGLPEYVTSTTKCLI